MDPGQKEPSHKITGAQTSQWMKQGLPCYGTELLVLASVLSVVHQKKKNHLVCSLLCRPKELCSYIQKHCSFTSLSDELSSTVTLGSTFKIHSENCSAAVESGRSPR